MIEPTGEIQRAYAEAWFRTIGMDEEDVQRMVAIELNEPMPWRLAALAAVLALVERDYDVIPRLTSEQEAAYRPRRRLRACVERWPGAVIEGDYDPRCCRFPKSCSATIYDDDRVTNDDLEPRP